MTAWTRVTVRAGADESSAVEDCLMACGAVSVTTRAADDEEVFAGAPGAMPLWRTCHVDGLFDDAPPATTVREALATIDGALLEAMEALPDTDWTSAYRQYAVDQVFAGRLRLAPRDAAEAADSLITLRLDPGLAFGSGSHPTTRLCLGWIARQSFIGRSAVDFGCGSGVLAIAMLLLGAAHVRGVDIDPQALLATQDNARFNNVDVACLETRLVGEPQDAKRFDVVVANILVNPLIELADRLCALVAPGGVLVLSGVLESQWERLRAAYPTIDFTERLAEDGWLLVAGTRRD
ncbi:MAG: 50S ribosomal protein L11 methyltransferase [Pseudomonadales bacterium]